MTVTRVLLFLLIVMTPTLIGAVLVTAPRWVAALGRCLPERRPKLAPEPLGKPIEQLAADLRRLIRLHDELNASALQGFRAVRIWSVEAAIGARAVEAARALDVPFREPPADGRFTRDELGALLRSLAAAGLALPASAGRFSDQF